ncbi:PREDICTED: venom carboxylesterase-6-like [Rhagoletis zephyria]|uniref:venom carboxylesterase-6-like n=1 Tax=Rhagoletis zephyria TaxID=28612 RepID=UPI000811525A|nr:PREDICTED: venom carboxylesterase-6-like [Rhagoletis zephyria]
MHNRLIIILIFYLNVATTKADAPEVCIDALGCIEGIYEPGNEVERYAAFYGVPFAKPPIGELRFKNPVPVEPWNGKLLAKEPHTECTQRNYLLTPLNTTGDEDCLYLNVYRPANSSDEKLPVLIYIHGGDFIFGTPNREFYGPEYFMDTNEVILVTIAYRLGPFGFLSSGDEHMTGNFGLKDQNLALKWVQSYISAFGGDPSRVTIFGHSSGGLSVHFHMLSPASQGLFRNAVPISGLANTVWAQPIDQKAQAIQLATAAGIRNASNISSIELVNALRNLPAEQLMEAYDALKTFISFRATIEEASWPEPFLTTNVRNLLNSNPPETVPWIAVNTPTKGEGVSIAPRLAGNSSLQAEFNENFDDLFKLLTNLPADESKEVNDVVERLVAEYMGGVRELNNDTLDGFLELLGDSCFMYPAYKAIADNVESSNGTIPEGYILFNYRGPYSYSERFTGSTKDFGTTHGDDSLYLFTSQVIAPDGYSKSSAEAALVKRYVEIYVEFAKNGEVEVFNKIQPCTKALFGKQGFCDYLSIVKEEEPFVVDNSWNTERMQLWEYVYKTFY